MITASIDGTTHRSVYARSKSDEHHVNRGALRNNHINAFVSMPRRHRFPIAPFRYACVRRGCIRAWSFYVISKPDEPTANRTGSPGAICANRDRHESLITAIFGYPPTVGPSFMITIGVPPSGICIAPTQAGSDGNAADPLCEIAFPSSR